MAKQRTALITGASGGIGRAIALSLAKEGYNIVIHYNSHEKEACALESEIKQISNAFRIKKNLENPNEAIELYKEAKAHFGHIDTVICSAGVAHYAGFEELTLADYRRVTDINLGSHMLLTSEALPDMRAKGFGRIIYISSVWGEQGASWEVLYSATKSALIGLTKALSKEVASSGITVNAVTPGVIDTAMLDAFSDEEKKDLLSRIPAGRFGRGEDVASLVRFLCSDCAQYITGEIIGVGGGFGK